MADSPFAKLYEPIKNTALYFERIGYKDTPEVSLECLKKLVLGQLHHIPFEDLDVFHGHKEPSLDTDALFEKIIINKRGGYCFELNGLFAKLLTAVGFSCRSHIARVVWHYPHLTPPSHQVNIVTLDDQDYFCDVGFGGPIPYCPLPISFEEEQVCSVTGRKYRFSKEGDWVTVSVWFEGAFQPMLMFLDTPCDPVDFVPLNCFCAHSPIEPFLHKQMVWLAHPDGRRSIDGNILKIEKDGQTTETALASDKELSDALLDYFGIVYKDVCGNWK